MRERLCGRGDALALVLIAAVVGIVLLYLTVGGSVVGVDTAVTFYPMWSQLGSRLGAGELPLWNPYQFSGVPLAADPQSGWGYLPVMILFSVLPLAVAAPALLGFHLLLAGWGAYALGRGLGLPITGALIAGLAFSNSGWFLQRSACCAVDTGTVAWLPWALLGVERAVHACTWGRCLAWWGLTGFAISQSLGLWLGQGSYYAFLTIGAFVAYRTLADPPRRGGRVGQRIGDGVRHGGAVLVLGLGFAAVGLWPRLEYLAQSSLAPSYDAFEQTSRGGWTPGEAVLRLTDPTSSYSAGSVTLGLAILALPLAGRRYAVPFWLAIVVVAVFLSTDTRTPVHGLLYGVIPGLEQVQAHLPQRVMSVAYLALALLAGAAVSALRFRGRRPEFFGFLMLGTLMLPFLAIYLGAGEPALPRSIVWPLAAFPLVVPSFMLAGRWKQSVPLSEIGARALPGIVVLALLVDLLPAGRLLIEEGEGGLRHQRVDLGQYYGPTEAAEFLRDESTVRRGVRDRYFGFDPTLTADDVANVLYRRQFGDERTRVLLVNNRASMLGLNDVQGQTAPAQVGRFAELMTALNGFAQDYHEASIFPEGLTSPLLDLLNARYIVVPNASITERPDLRGVYAAYPTIYQDADVRILENADALPRAWIVHQAREVDDGEALTLLADGLVDPRREVLLESEPPPVLPVLEPDSERADIVRYEPERIRIRTQTDAPGLLVLSEIAYPSWRATIDGEPVDLLIANHAFRAVAIPPGEHIVELRYVPTTLWGRTCYHLRDRRPICVRLPVSDCCQSSATSGAWWSRVRAWER